MIFQVIVPQSFYVELNEAALYYESKQKDLGVKFILDWEVAMQQLKKSPQLFQKKYKQFRAIQLDRFPYIVVYEVEINKIYVYRLIHSKRNPKKIFKK